jgi:hypothetical protein
MTPRIRQEIAKTRAAGVSVFVFPGLPGMPPSGMAYASGDRFYIDITANLNSVKLLYVLFHEVAHCLLGHMATISSRPTWITEKAADDLALQLLRGTWPAAVVLCEPLARENVRRYLQCMIDAEIWHHVDLDVARWAGCDLTPDAIAILTASQAEEDGDIIF